METPKKKEPRYCFSPTEYRRLKRRSDTLDTIQPIINEIKEKVERVAKKTRSLNQNKNKQ